MNFHLFPVHAKTLYCNHDSNRMAATARQAWFREGRPYYKCWPSVITALSKLSLAFVLKDSELPPRALLLRFAENHEPTIGNGKIASILSWRGQFVNGRCFYVEIDIRDHAGHLSAFWLSPNMKETVEKEMVHLYQRSRSNREDFLQRLKEESVNGEVSTANIRTSEETARLDSFALKIALTVHLLANDPSIIQPDVLADDRRRFDESTDPEFRQRLIDKARRRGIVGWRIGEQYETIPHFRRPHPALYHVGKGRTEQRIVFRAGSIVHRQKMTQVPTGYLEDDGTEVEQ